MLSSSSSSTLVVHQSLRPLGLDDHLRMLISINAIFEKGPASIACQYLILPIHLDLANDMLPSCLLLFGTELCRSMKDIRRCTPLYRPKWSPKTSPDEEVGENNECVQPISLKENNQKYHHARVHLRDPLLVPVVAYFLGSIVWYLGFVSAYLGLLSWYAGGLSSCLLGLLSYSSSLSLSLADSMLEQADELSSEYPQRFPPQSILTRAPPRVRP